MNKFNESCIIPLQFISNREFDKELIPVNEENTDKPWAKHVSSYITKRICKRSIFI